MNVSKRAMDSQLQRLYKQDYLDRKYDESFKLTHKPAIYLLSKKGRSVLLGRSPRYEAKVMRRLSRDKNLSDKHMNHWLSLLRTYAVLNKRYGNSLNFLTSTQLGPYDYFPDPIPDAFVRLKVEGLRWERLYLMYVCHEAEPLFITLRKIFNLIRFAEEDVYRWTNNTGREMPRILFVFDSASLQKLFTKKSRRAVYVVDADLITVHTTTLTDIERVDSWRSVLDTEELVALPEIG